MKIFSKRIAYIKELLYGQLNPSIFIPIILGIYALFASITEGYVIQLVFFFVVAIFLEIGFAALFKQKKNYLNLVYEASIIFLLLNVDTFFYFLVALFASLIFRFLRWQNSESKFYINNVLLGLIIADAIGGSISWWGFSIMPLSYILLFITAIFMFREGRFWGSFAFLLLFLITRLALTANLSFIITQMITPGFLLFAFFLLISPYSLRVLMLQDNLKKGFLTALMAVGLPIVGYPFDPLLSGLLLSEFTLAIMLYTSHNK